MRIHHRRPPRTKSPIVRHSSLIRESLLPSLSSGRSRSNRRCALARRSPRSAIWPSCGQRRFSRTNIRFAIPEFCNISARPAANTNTPPGPGMAPTTGDMSTMSPPSSVSPVRTAALRDRIGWALVTIGDVGVVCCFNKTVLHTLFSFRNASMNR